mgnify:CR=1 FL=1
MKKTCLITGGGGFLGTALAEKLTAEGFDAVSFSRTHHAHLEKKGIRQITGDIADLHSLSAASEGIYAIFHIAAKSGLAGDYRDFYNVNVEGTLNCI